MKSHIKNFWQVVIVIIILNLNYSDAMAQTVTHKKIDEFISSQKESYSNLRKDLHQHPELSGYEKESSAKIAALLKQYGYEVHENIGGYGVVGVLKNGNGPTIMLRCDMDALPMKEQTGLDYASVAVGLRNGAETPVFHACGHDMHMTVFLANAKLLAQLKSEWKGTLLMIAQPAEEINKGASGMIREGLFTRFPVPDYALAYHVDPNTPSGSISYTSGEALAGNCQYEITFYGVGAHGARPHTSIDPIVLASNAVLQFQTIVSRNIDPQEPAVITVGSFHAGIAYNIIPEEVVLQLSTRFFNDKTFGIIDSRLKAISQGLALAAGLPDDKMPKIKVLDSLAPVFNDIEFTDKTIQYFKSALGEEQVRITAPASVSEDFALYRLHSKKTVSALLWLGVGDHSYFEHKNEKNIPQLHNDKFMIDFDLAYKAGVKGMTTAVLGLFNQPLGE